MKINLTLCSPFLTQGSKHQLASSGSDPLTHKNEWQNKLILKEFQRDKEALAMQDEA